MYPSDAEWATIPPRRPDGTEPGDGWGLWATVGAVLLVVAGLVGLAIYLGGARRPTINLPTGTATIATIGPMPARNVQVVHGRECQIVPLNPPNGKILTAITANLPAGGFVQPVEDVLAGVPPKFWTKAPEGIGSTDLWVATLKAEDGPAQIGGRILGDVQLSAAGGAAGWRVPVQSSTDRVLHPKDLVVTTDWSTNIAWWKTENKTLRIANLPADALVCIDYGGTEVCKLPSEWVGR